MGAGIQRWWRSYADEVRAERQRWSAEQVRVFEADHIEIRILVAWDELREVIAKSGLRYFVTDQDEFR
jgi:hypothetical protein